MAEVGVVEPDGSLSLLENGDGRLIRIAPNTGITKVVAGVDKAYSVAHSSLGTVYLSAEAAGGSVYIVDTSVSERLYRVAPNGATTVVSRHQGPHGLIPVSYPLLGRANRQREGGDE